MDFLRSTIFGFRTNWNGKKFTQREHNESIFVIRISNLMQSILFWNSLLFSAVARKNGSSTITLIEKDHGPSISKAELHQKNRAVNLVGLQRCCVFWVASKQPNRTVNSDVYCQQLVKLEEAIKEKSPELANLKGVEFHHDNVGPHTYLAKHTKLLELCWEVMLHPRTAPTLHHRIIIYFEVYKTS